MLSPKIHLSLQIGLILAMFIIAVFLYFGLPELIPTHRNINGEVDHYGSKFMIFLIPVLMVIIELLFRFFPKYLKSENQISPNNPTFLFFQTGFLFFFFLVFLTICYASLHPDFFITSAIAFLLGLLFIFMGILMFKVPQNAVFGVRLPWTLSSKQNWKSTHTFTARCWISIGVLAMIGAFFLKGLALSIVFLILGGVCLPVIYSYWHFKKKETKNI